jgi:hypothetical protein
MSSAKWPQWLLLLRVAGAAAAQSGNPLRSPACLRALDACRLKSGLRTPA